MIFRTLATLFMCCAVLFANSAEAVVTNDSIQTASESTNQAVPGERFNIKQLIVPTVLVSVGAFGIKNGWFHKKINEPVRDGLADLRRDNYVKIDDYIQYLPVAAHLGMGLVGVESRHPLHSWELNLSAWNMATTGALWVPILWLAVWDSFAFTTTSIGLTMYLPAPELAF